MDDLLSRYSLKSVIHIPLLFSQFPAAFTDFSDANAIENLLICLWYVVRKKHERSFSISLSPNHTK